MLLKTYTNEDFYKARCVKCGWVQDVYLKKAKGTKCPNCSEMGYTYFPGDQSSHILGGIVHFVDAYNKKVEHERHIFPPQVYLPIIFACSNYETLLSDVVRELMNCYGQYLGRLGRMIVFEEVLSYYDRRANEKLFKMLTLKSVQQAVQDKFPQYFKDLDNLYDIRNHVVHGQEIDKAGVALSNANKGIDMLLLSVPIFQYLHNHYVVKFRDNVDYRKILRLGDHEEFKP
ncbi:MAG: hypothetical protein A2744_00015 [Candidatus Buchananbacteria bacterium RIFCSPHIGHO2_01_FULL_44_11]|uniref:Uncharacterized protein n=1 Tax=Candidatus Buchananbacteria bacterium RIFCSPHIGHO2_01_FULL_44_11 TaxID=1797535 RepID=A0A1G1Y072_9BACT|nr:MAG: hypothetical protein A2744_00015 [Candidatus Buchananbacteria bacterium RIFCSPHIGHO2_01_FULL_44_11]